MGIQNMSLTSCGIIPAADCLPACLEATARSYPWHLPSLEMKEARSSGHGMDLTAMWRGVPALPAGVEIRQVPIIKGDAKSVSIAAASIIAKVTRDRLMVQYDEIYPEYGFASNKGYGAAAHLEALKKYGPTPIHRRSFLKNLL